MISPDRVFSQVIVMFISFFPAKCGRKDSMRFLTETSVFKFLWRNVDEVVTRTRLDTLCLLHNKLCLEYSG